MLRLSTFISDVLHTVLTGFSTAVNSVVLATDTVLAAIGKLQAQIDDINSNLATSSANVIASGTNQATATLIVSQFNNVTSTTAGSSHGVVLPSGISGIFYIWNNSAHTIFVYPPAGAQINAIVVNGGYSLTNGSVVIFVVISNTLVLTK